MKCLGGYDEGVSCKEVVFRLFVYVYLILIFFCFDIVCVNIDK